MAYGTRCKHCGWQETNHVDGVIYEDQDPEKRIKGFRYNLRNCPGFSSDDPIGELRSFEADRVKIDVNLLLPSSAQQRIREFQQRAEKGGVKHK